MRRLWSTGNTAGFAPRVQTSAFSTLSYPSEANDAYAPIEDVSYWFQHRAACLLALMRRFPTTGEFYDIGAGNGFTCSALARAGVSCVAIEPGPGALNARRRGVAHVIQSTLAGASLRPGTVTGAGAFDVLEHIADDEAFLREIRSLMPHDARFFCTVPAGPGLWSHDDVRAGHFRRYTVFTLRRTLAAAGFRVEFISPFFTWLVAPVVVLRAVPSRFGFGRMKQFSAEQLVREHTLPPALRPLIAPIHAWEIERLGAGRTLPFGTSLVAVAHAA